jgi:hypothetical protein
MCAVCVSPDLSYPGNQAVLGAAVTGVDEAQKDLKKGQVTASGYLYRMLEDTNRQVQHLILEIGAAGHQRVAAVALWNINSGSEMVRVLRESFGANYLGTIVDAFPFGDFTGDQWTELVTAFRDSSVGPKNPSPACNSPIPYCNDFTSRTAGAPDALVVYLFVPQLTKFLRAFATAFPDSATRPALYFMFTAAGSESLLNHEAAVHMVGQNGIGYTLAAEGAAQFDSDLEKLVPGQRSVGTGPVYDAIITLALAAYATGLEQPTAEDVKQALDRINDPAGEGIGYRQYARARQVLDDGGSINYQGVTGALDWDITNAVRSYYSMWGVIESGGSRLYETRATITP